MGHTIVAGLPNWPAWRRVVDLLGGPRLDAAGVAGATCRAAERRLVELQNDPSLAYCFWLLVRLAGAARTEDFAAELGHLGIAARPDDSALSLVARVADQTRVRLNRYPESGPFGEMAALALRQTLRDTVGAEGRSLFGSSLEDLERAFRRHSSSAQFGLLAKGFFGDFMARTLRYYVDRELAGAAGGAGLANLAATADFSRAMDRHARATAEVVRGFAAGWYNPAKWEQLGQIGPDDAERFVAHALQKLRLALRKQAPR